MVSVAVAVELARPPGSFAPPVALVRIRITVSSNSTSGPLKTGTVKVALVWPLKNRSVPLTDV